MTYGEIIHSELPFLKLCMDFPHAAMLAEARRVAEHFRPHRESDVGVSGWLSLVLHGVGVHKSLGYESYGIRREDQAQHYRWTEVAELCPVTTRYFREVFPVRSYGRIRYMLLQPGGRVPFHVDYSESKLASISMALNNPSGACFFMRTNTSSSEIPFQAGDAFALNLSYPHSVVNEGTEERYHIIVHALESTPAFRELICRSFAERRG